MFPGTNDWISLIFATYVLRCGALRSHLQRQNAEQVITESASNFIVPRTDTNKNTNVIMSSHKHVHMFVQVCVDQVVYWYIYYSCT